MNHAPSDSGTDGLLPCPFCGGKANVYENEVDFVTKWSVGCGDCNCNMDVCEDTPADAAVVWNTRIPGSAQVLTTPPNTASPLIGGEPSEATFADGTAGAAQQPRTEGPFKDGDPIVAALIWEVDRAVKQALRDGGKYETTIRWILNEHLRGFAQAPYGLAEDVRAAATQVAEWQGNRVAQQPVDPACSGCAGITHFHTCGDPSKGPQCDPVAQEALDRDTIATLTKQVLFYQEQLSTRYPCPGCDGHECDKRSGAMRGPAYTSRLDELEAAIREIRRVVTAPKTNEFAIARVHEITSRSIRGCKSTG